MVIAEGELATKDGLKLYRRSWIAARPHGRIILVHGIGEHCGRYEHVAAFLVNLGFSVHSFDQRGFGHSGGRRGHCDSFDQYLSDLDLLVDAVRAETPTLPTVLYGHSFGGLVVLAYGLAHPQKLDGVISSAPSLSITMPIPAWKTRLADLLNGVWPTFTLPSGLNAADLSRNPEVGRKYAADPLVGDKVSARYYKEVTRVMAETVARAPRFAVPLLLVQGSADRLTSPAATAAWFAEAGTASGRLDKTMKVYDGFFHELHNEDERAALFADLKEWLARYPEV